MCSNVINQKIKIRKENFIIEHLHFFPPSRWDLGEEGVQGGSNGTGADQKTNRLKNDMSRMGKDQQRSKKVP